MLEREHQEPPIPTLKYHQHLLWRQTVHSRRAWRPSARYFHSYRGPILTHCESFGGLYGTRTLHHLPARCLTNLPDLGGFPFGFGLAIAWSQALVAFLVQPLLRLKLSIAGRPIWIRVLLRPPRPRGRFFSREVLWEFVLRQLRRRRQLYLRQGIQFPLSPMSDKPNSRAPGKRRATSSKHKKERGWGPYKSVLKERSVDFNLTLDVQNLHQEIRELTTLRELLHAKELNRRHLRDGSLLQTVRAFYRLFHHGYRLRSSSSSHPRQHQGDRWPVIPDSSEQRAFIDSVMDPNVEIGGGFAGTPHFIEQMEIYSTCFHNIKLLLQEYEITQTDTSVIISTRASFSFRIARATIELVFPHIVGHEHLISQLVDRFVESDMRITFWFDGGNDIGNSRGDQCVRYNVDAALVSVFSQLLRSPRDMALLLGRALITPNSLLGIQSEGQIYGSGSVSL